MKVICIPEHVNQLRQEIEKDPDAWQNHPEYILLKNEYSDIQGHLVRGNYSDPVQVRDYIDEMNLISDQKYGFCLDVGVCNLFGQNMNTFITVLGERLKMVIIRENDGMSDSRCLPFSSVHKGNSKIDWTGLIRGLRAIQFDGVIVLDYLESVRAMPLSLKKYYVDFAREMGKYFQWQIEMERMIERYPSRVLFGAGNMCQNYLRCYGTDFPPLFICDNNQQRWNTKMEGFDVRNPESLRDLPSDCAIFICNVYYEEVYQQLQNMGIKHPIEYFSDEYMPSYD